jgi:hypothetical protein
MRRILAAAVLVVVAALPAFAATVRYRTDGDLVAISDRVVRGRVLDAVVERGPDGLIRTRTRIAVVEDLAGGGEAIVAVSELGGRLPDGRALWIPGAPQFTPGDEVVLCLERAAAGYRTVAMAFSAFRVAVQASGARVLSRLDGEIALVGAPAGVVPSRTLVAFRAAAAAVTGQASRPVLGDAEAAALVASVPAVAPFRLLGEEDGRAFRWQQADLGTPLVWYRNTLTQSPIVNGDTDNEIRVALEAWTAPPEASINLTFGGTQFDDEPASREYCSDANLGVGLITFGDPANDPVLGSGVLAIGGGCGSGIIHTINGTSFEAFSHGLVVLNDTQALSGFTSPPNITRILQHEIGHAIGLGHTDQGTDNIMYPSCCPPGMPVPPALGPDDRAGVAFIYPPPAVTCSYTLSPASGTVPAIGGEGSFTVTPSHPSCTWTATAMAPWLIVVDGGAGTGAGTVRYAVRPHLGVFAIRTGTLSIGGQTFTVTQTGDGESDGDQLPNEWENFFGLDPLSAAGENGASGDPDGDGLTNAQELAAGSHPRGTFRRYFAEGAVNAFFDSRITLFNPRATAAAALLRVQLENGVEEAWPVPLSGFERRAITTPILRALSGGAFSTVIESDQPIVVDRTMRWDATGYGAHAEVGIESPATTWYLAEGSTAGDFALFYLLQNPGAASVQATVRFLRPAPLAPIERVYTLAARARLTIPVDSVAPELASTDVSGVVTAALPIIVERAMYLNRPGQPFAAGHGSAGVTAPALEWFLAEGSTGTFFDLFILLANPDAQAALVQVDYLLPNGTTLTKQYTVAAESRYTIYVDAEQIPAGSGQRPLAGTAVGARVRSMNGVPIVVERSMWWPDGDWYEAHNTPATRVTGTEWAFADGYVGGPNSSETFLLITNPSDRHCLVIVQIYLPGTSFGELVGIPANGRVTLPIGAFFPESLGQRFAIRVLTALEDPVPFVVERAMYDSPQGVLWNSGTAAIGVRLTP